MMYRAVEIVDGESVKPVHFVGVHPIKWSKVVGDVAPDVGFVEDDGANALLEVCKLALQAWYDDEQSLEVWESLYDRLVAAVAKMEEADAAPN